MNNRERANLLRSAASALEHGRHSTANKKLSAALRETELDSSDVATILAALRLFQSEYEDMDSIQIADAWPDHFNVQSPGGEVGGETPGDLRVVPAPLGTEDIDGLCERINCARGVAVL